LQMASTNPSSLVAIPLCTLSHLHFKSLFN
jgi:hypothetical protein